MLVCRHWLSRIRTRRGKRNPDVTQGVTLPATSSAQLECSFPEPRRSFRRPARCLRGCSFLHLDAIDTFTDAIYLTAEAIDLFAEVIDLFVEAIDQFPEVIDQFGGTHRSLPGSHRSVRGTHRSVRGSHRSVPRSHRSVRGTHRSVPGSHRSVRGASEHPKMEPVPIKLSRLRQLRSATTVTPPRWR